MLRKPAVEDGKLVHRRVPPSDDAVSGIQQDDAEQLHCEAYHSLRQDGPGVDQLRIQRQPQTLKVEDGNVRAPHTASA